MQEMVDGLICMVSSLFLLDAQNIAILLYYFFFAGEIHLRKALRPSAIRKIALLPRARGEKKLTTSSS